MAKKIVTLYIDDTSLRLVVARGKRIKEWADMPLEPGLIKGAMVIKEAEVVAKIKQLFKAQKVKSKEIILGVSGLHCLSRPVILPQLPRVMLDEAVKREAKRVLPVPPEQLYISWQPIPAPEGKTQVFLVALPRRTADAQLKALHQAGLKPHLMDIKPLLLARAVKEATAVIVDVQATEFDIVIMSDGVPQPMRTIAFATEELSWQEKLTTIRNELDRTITFYNSNNPEKTLAHSVHIFASGELANKPELCQSLSDNLGYPVLPLPLPLECPEGLDPSRYSANIGLILKEFPSGKEVGASVANLNVLPVPYQPKPVSLTNIFAPPVAAIAAGLLVFLVMLNQSAASDVGSVRSKLDTANLRLKQEQAQRQKLSNDIAQLQKKVTELKASRDSLSAAVGSLERQTTGINRQLEATINSLPKDITLSSISHNKDALTINGRAPGEKDVLSYLTKLDASGGFGELTIKNMSRIKGGGIDFVLTGSLEKAEYTGSAVQGILDRLPGTVALTGVTGTGGTFTVNGKAQSEDAVLSYLRDLEASGKFLEIKINKIEKMPDKTVEFSLLVKAGK